MPASIHTLLADELDISDEKAEKLLSAMLREVQKRARKQEDGVRLPKLGRFTVDDGDLAFSPSASLARAVNHRFEGLDIEDLANAPGDVEQETEEEEDGPSTIALGYQAGGNLDPIEEDEAAPASDAAPDDAAPDTAEFQAPDPNGDAAPDTAEFQAPDTGASGNEVHDDEASETAASRNQERDDETESEGAPETAEFQSHPPGASLSGATAPDASAPEENGASSSQSSTERPVSDSQEPAADESVSSAPESTDSPPQTEELYPFVEDVPGGSPSEEESSSEIDETSDTDEQPVADEPVADEPVADEPVADEPVADEPVADEPVADEPVADEKPADDEQSAADDKEQHDQLTGIWDEVEEETGSMSAMSSTSDATASSENEDESSPSSDPFTTTAEPESDPVADTEAASDSESAPSRDPEPTPSSPPTSSDTEASEGSASRMVAAVMVFLLLGGGAWYILDQRGVIPGPADTFATLKARVASDAQRARENQADSPDESDLEGGFPQASSPTTDEPERSTTDDAENDPADDAASETPTASSESEPSSTTDDASSSSPPTTDDPTADSRTIAPADGGWSIIVASRADQEGASELVSTYRDRITDSQIPIDVIEATVDNSVRYRVGVGQFSTQSEAQRFLKERQSDLPDGAWTLRLQ